MAHLWMFYLLKMVDLSMAVLVGHNQMGTIFSFPLTLFQF